MEKVVVVMAVYKPNIYFFEKQIKSILNQSYSNIDCIILDDSYDSDWYQKILNITNQYDNLYLYKNNINIGSFRTFLKGISIAQSYFPKYIAFSDQDDVWIEKKIEILINKLQKSKSILVHSDAIIIDENDNLIYDSLFKYEKRVYLKPTTYDLFFKNTVTGCTCLFDNKVSVMIDLEIFKYKPFYHHDLYISLLASSIGKIDFVNEKLVQYRFHQNNLVGPRKPKSLLKTLGLIFFSLFNRKLYLSIIRTYILYRRIYIDYSKSINSRKNYDPLNLIFKSKFRIKGSLDVVIKILFVYFFLKMRKNVN